MKRTTSTRRGLVALLIVAAAFALMMVTFTMNVAQAAPSDPYGGGEPTVLPTLIINTVEPEPQPEPQPEVMARQQQQEPGALPITGASLSLFMLIGAGAIGSGTALVRRSRKRANR